MKIFEIGTGYTSIPAKIGAATEIVVEELTSSLLKLGYDATIVDIKDSKRTATSLPITEVYMPQLFNTTDTTLGLVHKLKRVLYSFSLTFKLHRIIKRCNDNKIVLHFHNQYNLFFFLKLTSKALRNKVSIAYTVHSHVWFGNWNEICDTVKKRYFQEVYCVRHADHVFVLNDSAKAMMIDKIGVAPDKVHKVINGVNTSVYDEQAPAPPSMASFIADNHLADKKVIFQVGSVCDRKNQLGSLKLLLPTLKSQPNTTYMYAGGIIDAAYKQQIDNFAAQNDITNQVIYAGEVAPGAELNALYKASRVSIFNSKSEAFSLVIMESLSASRPIFICNGILNSLPFMKSGNENGIMPITKTFDADLSAILNDDVKYCGEKAKAREFITKEYSWGVAAKQYIQYF